MQVNGSFDTKRIHELNSLNKLTGKEKMLIELNDSEETMSVTVDSLLGYIANQINAGTGGSHTPSEDTGIHKINLGEPDIPASARTKGHFYIREVSVQSAKISAGLPQVLIVGDNLSLRKVNV